MNCFRNFFHWNFSPWLIFTKLLTLELWKKHGKQFQTITSIIQIPYILLFSVETLFKKIPRRRTVNFAETLRRLFAEHLQATTSGPWPDECHSSFKKASKENSPHIKSFWKICFFRFITLWNDIYLNLWHWGGGKTLQIKIITSENCVTTFLSVSPISSDRKTSNQPGLYQ